MDTLELDNHLNALIIAGKSVDAFQTFYAEDVVVGHAPGRVLDVGCGEGWLCRALEARGIDLVGIDGSAALIESARSSGPGSTIFL